MIDYHNIWESINNESRSNPLQPQIARRIPSIGLYPVFLATDFRKGIRLLYIKLDSNHDIITDNLPQFSGLEISITVTSLGEFNNLEFIKFTQSIPNTDNIFELVISDVCDNIVRLQDRVNLNATLTRVLNDWKIFFEKQENEILSIESQKGLVGELHFLRDYLFQKYSFSESLFYWTGSERTNHDFQIIGNAVEIKTTSGKQHKKFTVSSERQLDITGLEHLYLSIFSLNLHSNMPDRTLPALIRKIHSVIQDDPIALFQFQLKLVKYGYNEILADKYTIGFSVFEMKFFEVAEGFPRLLQRNLPDGVGDLKYSVVVAACAQFEITNEIIKHL
ncbi:MAG TPA: PD-(D/E)XK motif protein [Ignavibacteria bacterium]|nr:PD-(D/E)XK motif protein [Ignavibacteria bacterium]HMR41258.1 PD-(D/E)XK motif protein [Ignavibacteria bacterium]